MKPGLLASLFGMLAGAGMAVAQPAASPPLATPETGEIFSECMSCADQPTNCLWFTGEYLMWWLKEYRTPPLATTGPADVFAPGSLGQPGTGILFGGDRLNLDTFHGGRFRGGFWCDEDQTLGFEASWFFLGPQSNSTVIGPGTSGVLSRPFTIQNFDLGISSITAFPDVASGNVIVSNRTSLWGADANFRWNLLSGSSGRLDFLIGAKYLNLDEDLAIKEDITTLVPIVQPSLPAATRIGVLDSFSTHDDFYGGMLGLAGEWRCGIFVLDVRGTVALGGTHQVIDIFGGQSISIPGTTPVNFVGGLLALPSNMGRHTRDEFSVVPEFTARLGLQVTQNIRPFVGYNFLYWSDVVRPGDQIDLALDATQIPNFVLPPGTRPASPQQPVVSFSDHGFWAQGVTFGVELRW